MNLQEISDEVDRELADERNQDAEREAARKTFLDELFGSSDRLDWQAPSAVEDFDAVLRQHAAQLRNAVRHVMGDVLWDAYSMERRAKAIGALTRMIRTNVAIARALDTKAPTAKSKTVHGVGAPKDPQD